MKKNILLTPRLRGEKRIKTFQRKIEHSIKRLPENDQQRQKIEALLGLNGRSSLLLAADMEARQEFADQFVKLMLEHRREHRGYFYYHLTLLDDIGAVSDRNPVIDIKALQNKADRALRRLELSGIYIVEAHPLANYPQGGGGRSILFHIHAIAWSKTKLHLTAAEAELISGGGWRNSLGAKPAKVQLVGDNEDDLERLVRYVVKPPRSAKNRRPRKEDSSKFRLMNTVKGYRPELALRTMEIFSQIELLNLISSVGTGKQVRQKLRSQMNTWHRKRPADDSTLPGDFDIWQFWYDFRQSFGSKRYLPVRISSGGYRMRPIKLSWPLGLPKLIKHRTLRHPRSKYQKSRGGMLRKHQN